MSVAEQFLAGQKFAQGLLDTYRSARQSRELEDISKAQPVNADFLSDDASAKVQAAAADPSQQIGYDVGAKAYMATPKLGENEMGPAQPKQIATAAPMTELLGKRTPGTMTPDQVSNAKFKAMADVIAKSDPIQGMRLQREVKQGERDDKRWEREERTAKEEEDFKTGQQAEFAQTIYGKRMGEYATQVQAYEQYQAKLKSGAAPETLGAPPAMPQRPTYSEGESLADAGRLLAFKASKGKADPAEILQYAERLRKVDEEGYGKALKLAQGGAPLDSVIEQFNKAGSVKLDPTAVVSDQMVPGADGVPARVIKVRDASGNVRTINALSELDAIGQAENYFSRFDKNRTFNLNARKTEVAERQAATAERKIDLLLMGAGRSGGRGSAQGGGDTPQGLPDPMAGFDSKKAYATAAEMAAKESELAGKPATPQQIAARATEIYRSLESEFQTSGVKNLALQGFERSARNIKTPQELSALYQRGLAGGLTPDDMVAIDRRFAEVARAAKPATGGNQGAAPAAGSGKAQTPPDAIVAAPAKPTYTPPADSPAGKAQAAREAARNASMQQEAQRVKAVTDAASAAIASGDAAAAQAVQSMPGFGVLPLEQKAAIRRIVFGR